jgi:hypothetical protein
MNWFTRHRKPALAAHKVKAPRRARLVLEALEDRTVLTTFVVGTGGPAGLQHFTTLQDALGAAANGDSILVEATGVQAGTFAGNAAVVSTSGTTQVTVNQAPSNYQTGEIVTITHLGNVVAESVIDNVAAVSGQPNQTLLTLHDSFGTTPVAGDTVAVTSGEVAIDKNVSITGQAGPGQRTAPTNGYANGLTVWAGTTGVSLTTLNLTGNTLTFQGTLTATQSAGKAGGATGAVVTASVADSVIIGAGANSETIQNSTINASLTETGSGAASGNGHNLILGNVIGVTSPGTLTLTGNLTGNTTADTVTNNVITGNVTLSNEDGLLFQNNVVTATSGYAVQISDSQGATVNENTIDNSATSTFTTVVAGSPGGGIIPNGTTGVPTAAGIAVLQGLTGTAANKIGVTVSNNIISATKAVGVFFAVNNTGGANGGANFSATVFGNDVRDAQFGVVIDGDGSNSSTTLGTIDLGGGANGSPGGNVFRTFTKAQAQGGTRFAIAVENAGASATVEAKNNVFDTATPTDVILDSSHNNTTPPAGFGSVTNGTIDVGTPLTGSAAFINDLYLDFVHHVPDAGGAAFWTGVFNGPGGSGAVAQGVVFSKEALTRDVDNLYLDILNRQADSAGESFWVSQLQAGMSLEVVAANFYGSGEFQDLVVGSGGSSSNPAGSYVNELFNEILNREGTSSDVSFWISYFNSHGATATALAFLQSTEFRTDAVVTLYGQGSTQLQGLPIGGSVTTPEGTRTGLSVAPDLLHRTAVPSQTEVNFWVNGTLTLLQIEDGIAGSAEFVSNG